MSAAQNLAFRVAEQAIGLGEAVQMLLKPASSETHMPPEQLASWLDWLLLVRCLDKAVARSPTAVLRDLSAAAPQRVCSKTFSHGDVIWKCRTCQVGDDTCVVCQACFQDADHQGHDVSFYISRQECPALAPTHYCRHCSHVFSHAASGLTVQPSARPPAPPLGRQTDGGCCDCGDSGAWDPLGFCSKHGRLQTIPDLLGSIPEAILPSAQVARDNPPAPRPKSAHRPAHPLDLPPRLAPAHAPAQCPVPHDTPLASGCAGDVQRDPGQGWRSCARFRAIGGIACGGGRCSREKLAASRGGVQLLPRPSSVARPAPPKHPCVSPPHSRPAGTPVDHANLRRL